MPFSEHVYKLCLDYRLYSATIKMQSDLGLGKAYSGMLPFVTGLHSMGYLSKEDFELYQNKYSESLESAHNNKNKSPIEVAKARTRENNNRTQNGYYSEALKQWETMKQSSKLYYVKKAASEAHLKNAKLILALGADLISGGEAL